jgi:hypothetical protein
MPHVTPTTTTTTETQNQNKTDTKLPSPWVPGAWGIVMLTKLGLYENITPPYNLHCHLAQGQC